MENVVVRHSLTIFVIIIVRFCPESTSDAFIIHVELRAHQDSFSFRLFLNKNIQIKDLLQQVDGHKVSVNSRLG